MATLDDKILGEKLDYYCSSSEEEEGEQTDDVENDDQRPKAAAKSGPTFIPEEQVKQWEGYSVNTGPKGVIQDWRRFKQLESEKREEQDHERADLIKKLSITCKPQQQLEKEKEEESRMQAEMREVVGGVEEEFLKEYRKRRMEEMLKKTNNLPVFGRVVNLEGSQQLLDAIDSENNQVNVIVHVYETGVAGCEAMNGCIDCLASDFPNSKFCRIRASSTKLSKKFLKKGVPALLVYRAGNLIGSFVQLTRDLGEDFFATDVESLLVEHGMLPDRSCIPSVVRETSNLRGNTPESDFELD